MQETQEKNAGLRGQLREDIRAMKMSNVGTLSLIIAFFQRLDFAAIFLYRAGSSLFHRGRGGRLLSVFLWRLNFFMTSADIRPNAQIGPGFNIPHPLGIIIGPSRIGRNVTILKNVTLGLQNLDVDITDPKNFAVVDDDVIIGTNAVVLGPVHIGKGSKIAPNSVVTKDVPEGSMAIGNPARIFPLTAP